MTVKTKRTHWTEGTTPVADIKPLTQGLKDKFAGVAVMQKFRGKEDSFWSFPRDGITATLSDLYMCCPMQVYWKYIRGFSGRDMPMGPEFGSCGHKVLEWAYNDHGQSWPWLVQNDQALAEYVSDLVSQYEKFWLAQVRKPTQKQLEQQELVYGMAECVLPNYIRRWDGDFNGGKYSYGMKGMAAPVEWIEREQPFRVLYTYPDGLQVPVRGKRDGVFRDKSGAVWVKDNKFYSRFDDNAIIDVLPVDFQQMLYVWAFLQTCDTVTPGKLKSIGVILDVTKRPGNRQGKKESFTEFLARVAAECDDPETYNDHFIRFQMKLTTAEVAKWKAETLDPFMQDIRLWWEGKTPHYARHRNLTGKYGKAEMYGLVLSGDSTGYYQREHVFPELAETA